jgi:drug/metabolite transporter (DMT)-like permease
VSHRRAVLILLGCTFVWGASFTLNKMVLATISPMIFLATRFALGSLLLSPMYSRTSRADWRAGLQLGTLFGVQLALFVAGLESLPPARAAFLFSIQTPLVPLIVLLVDRRPPSRRDLVAVAIAVVGSWLLTRPADGTSGLGRGDLLMGASALCAACYVVAAGHLAPRHEPMRLLAVQFVAMAGVGAVLAATVEAPRLGLTPLTILLVPFLAVSSIATFGGQLLGQRLIGPIEAALIYALEPVIAAATSFVSFGERMTGAQWLGGGLIVGAAVVVGVGSRGSGVGSRGSGVGNRE